MSLLFFLLTLFTALSVPLLPLFPAFVPSVGLRPLQWGHDRRVRFAQVLVVWGFALVGLWLAPSAWGGLALLVAVWVSIIAPHFFPHRIFVALTQPARAPQGLAPTAPVVATEVAGAVVAYPLEMLVPHHVINDVVGDVPILAAW